MKNSLPLLIVCSWLFWTVNALAVNSLCLTQISPQTPSALANGEDVTITFDYQIDNAAGGRIFIRPFTNGALSPSYAASGSPIYMGSGNATAEFTITSGNVEVDELRVSITNPDQSTILFEYYIPVELYFGPNAARVKDIPYQASYLIGEDATFDFDYNVSQSGGTRIFIRPFTNGSLTPAYGASGSPVFNGNGSTSAFLRITSGVNVVVDQLRIRITNDDQSILLQEYFVPVEWHFSTAKVFTIGLESGGDKRLDLNEDVTTRLSYETTEADGIRIFIRPFSDGSLSSNYAASGSPIFSGSGSMTGDFTITSGREMVDQLRIRCTTADQSQVLLEYFVPAHYFFGDVYVSELTYCPDSPARLNFGDRVNIPFSYEVNHPGGTRIFIRPMSNGSLTPGYGAAPSGIFSGTGNDAGFFTINSGDVVVDELRVRIYNDDQSQLLLEYFEPVQFTYGNPITSIAGPPVIREQVGAPFPNPFQSSLHVPIHLTQPENVRVEWLNTRGQTVGSTYETRVTQLGKTQIDMTAEGLPDGLYLLRVTGETFQASYPVSLRQ